MVTQQGNSTKVSRLRAQQLFAGVSDHTLASTSVRFATFAPGDVISRQGDRHSPLVLVVSGLAHATRISEEGREISIEFARPGGACGESAILLGQPATASLLAVTEVLVGLVERAEATRLFADAVVSKGLMQLMSNRLERLVDGQTVLTRPSPKFHGAAEVAASPSPCPD
jgi:CRP-like cAMP-binding protein